MYKLLVDGFAAPLLAALKARKVSQSELARRLRVSPVTVSQWVTGKRKVPRPEAIRAIASALGMTPEDLLQPAEAPHVEAERIPVFGEIHGLENGVVLGSVVDEVESTPIEKSLNVFALKMTGDSMEPAIFDGDICYFVPPGDSSPKDGGICIFGMDGCREWMVRRVYRISGQRIILKAENNAIPPLEITPEAVAFSVKGTIWKVERYFQRPLQNLLSKGKILSETGKGSRKIFFSLSKFQLKKDLNICQSETSSRKVTSGRISRLKQVLSRYAKHPLFPSLYIKLKKLWISAKKLKKAQKPGGSSNQILEKRSILLISKWGIVKQLIGVIREALEIPDSPIKKRGKKCKGSLPKKSSEAIKLPDSPVKTEEKE